MYLSAHASTWPWRLRQNAAISRTSVRVFPVPGGPCQSVTLWFIAASIAILWLLFRSSCMVVKSALTVPLCTPNNFPLMRNGGLLATVKSSWLIRILEGVLSERVFSSALAFTSSTPNIKPLTAIAPSPTIIVLSDFVPSFEVLDCATVAVDRREPLMSCLRSGEAKHSIASIQRSYVTRLAETSRRHLDITFRSFAWRDETATRKNLSYNKDYVLLRVHIRSRKPSKVQI